MVAGKYVRQQNVVIVSNKRLENLHRSWQWPTYANPFYLWQLFIALDHSNHDSRPLTIGRICDYVWYIAMIIAFCILYMLVRERCDIRERERGNAKCSNRRAQ